MHEVRGLRQHQTALLQAADDATGKIAWIGMRFRVNRRLAVRIESNHIGKRATDVGSYYETHPSPQRRAAAFAPAFVHIPSG
jgi:hypothetical protein